MSEEQRNDPTLERAEQASLVERFEITGLYGYRTISLEAPWAATVLIAKNGSGKTTLLATLDAFLRGQFSRLRELQFNEIRCKLRPIDRELIISHDDIADIFHLDQVQELDSLAKELDFDHDKLFSALESADFIGYRYSDDKLLDTIMRKVGHNPREADTYRNSIILAAYNRAPRAAEVLRSLKSALNGIEIVYLPTYRRIELPLSQDTRRTSLYPRFRKMRFSSTSSLMPSDIQFGLDDITARLSELNDQIVFESSFKYRNISANIINELIDGTFENAQFAEDIPTREELSLFFSRLEEGRRTGTFREVSVPDFDRIYAQDSQEINENKVLRFFLGKLSEVIAATQSIEARVDEFVERCNRYLSSSDPSTDLGLKAPSSASDSKILRVSRSKLKVHAESLPSGRKIPLNSLSSGEKQMVSLFAKLFLYQRNKIILIDEPELSLSIEWQRHIIPDIVSSPSCQQVIAITHSPFIFDNCLEPFARSLNVCIDTSSLPDSPEESEDEDGAQVDE